MNYCTGTRRVYYTLYCIYMKLLCWSQLEAVLKIKQLYEFFSALLLYVLYSMYCTQESVLYSVHHTAVPAVNMSTHCRVQQYSAEIVLYVL